MCLTTLQFEPYYAIGLIETQTEIMQGKSKYSQTKIIIAKVYTILLLVMWLRSDHIQIMLNSTQHMTPK